MPTATKPKQIEEYVGRVNSGHTGVSIARMEIISRLTRWHIAPRRF